MIQFDIFFLMSVEKKRIRWVANGSGFEPSDFKMRILSIIYTNRNTQNELRSVLINLKFFSETVFVFKNRKLFSKISKVFWIFFF